MSEPLEREDWIRLARTWATTASAALHEPVRGDKDIDSAIVALEKCLRILREEVKALTT